MRGRAGLVLISLLLGGCFAPLVPPEQTSSPDLAVDFSWAPETPRVGQPVAFVPDITSAHTGDRLVRLAWRFGDGDATMDQTPHHIYTAAGTYDVRLQVETELGGVASATKAITVTAGPAAPIRGPPDSPDLEPADELEPPTIGVEVRANVATLSYEWSRIPRSVRWEFHDGIVLTEPTVERVFYETGDFPLRLLLIAEDGQWGEAFALLNITEVPFEPHVVVGVPDSGFNVYHEVYRRPERTAHPCTYILGYPCDIPALELTFDAASWQEAFEADRSKWEKIRPGDRYWIPGTNIIGAVCDQPYQGSNLGSTDPLGGVDHCILDDTSMHGTGTTSSVLSENPDALLIVVEGNSGGAAYLTDGFYPVDIVSYSWGPPAPLVGLGALAQGHDPFYVAAAGNEGSFPVAVDGSKSDPSVITVTAGDGATRTEPGYSGWKTADFASEYCRPTAQTRVFTGERPNYCGTSFSAPTFAGALSKVVLELRRQSGYIGSIQDGLVDPILGITKWDVREALNRTASYTPDSPFPPGSHYVPVREEAPFYQWGWGYVARNEVDEVLLCVLEGACPEKPLAATLYMEAVWEIRKAQNPP